jgi:hypothetical protein
LDGQPVHVLVILARRFSTAEGWSSEDPVTLAREEAEVTGFLLAQE